MPIMRVVADTSWLPGDEEPAGAHGGQGSLTQADVTPGEEPTTKPDGGA